MSLISISVLRNLIKVNNKLTFCSLTIF